MDFQKWYSIENHYQKELIQYWLERFTQLQKMTYEVTEKIHGANFSIVADINRDVKFAKRSGFITEKDKGFYGYKGVFERPSYMSLVEQIKNIAEEAQQSVQLFGELFGGNIQKGVLYGDEKNFRWYALKIGKDLIAPKDALVILSKTFRVPSLGFVKPEGNLFKMIDEINHEHQSAFTPKDYKDDNVIEGVVIVPYEEVITNGQSFFMIKKKNEKFKDKSSKAKRIHKVLVIEDHVQELIDEVDLYINENRTNDLFSKVGNFEDIREISKFAKEYFKDVFSDFEKDNYTAWNNLNGIEQGIIKKRLGSLIYQELKISLMR